MPIASDNPITQPERTYPYWWVKSFRVDAADPNQPVIVGAQFVRVTERDEYGVADALAGSETGYQLGDLFALAAQDADVAALIDNLISTVGALAKAAGRIE